MIVIPKNAYPRTKFFICAQRYPALVRTLYDTPERYCMWIHLILLDIWWRLTNPVMWHRLPCCQRAVKRALKVLTRGEYNYTQIGLVFGVTILGNRDRYK